MMRKCISIRNGFIFCIIVHCQLSIAYSNGIPLPNQSVAQAKGVTAGMGVGTLNSAGCKTLWTWTGHGSYSYEPFLSGGIGIKFVGGNIDSEYSLINQRYSINAKFLDSQPRYVLFAGPVFSFENVDLSSLRKEFVNIGDKDETNAETGCSKLYADIGSSIGYQTGVGYLATPNFGLTFGHNLDLTLKGAFIASFSGSIAFNLREQFEKLKRNTRNCWLSLEYSTSLNKSDASTHNLILGFLLGF